MLMTEKHTDNTSYNHSHKKSTKSFAKGLDKAETPLIIFSDKRQATSDKRQATSDKQQSGIKTRSPQTNSQLNTNFLTVNRTHKSKFLSLCVFYISIKPQRTPRTQRNNRNVLQIETIQSKTNSPETLNPRGFQRGVPFGRRKRKEGFGEEGKPVLSGCPSSPKTVGGLRGTLPPKKEIKLC